MVCNAHTEFGQGDPPIAALAGNKQETVLTSISTQPGVRQVAPWKEGFIHHHHRHHHHHPMGRALHRANLYGIA